MPTSVLDHWLEKIQADGEAVARERAKQVTVTADFTRDNGDELTVTVTGLAPFSAEPSVGALSGVPGWRVFSQPWLSQCGVRHTITKANRLSGPLRGPVWGGLPLLNESEARRLAMALNVQIAEVA